MTSHRSFLTDIILPGFRHSVSGVTKYEDPVCGSYAISDEAEELLKANPKIRAEIACVLAVRKRRGAGRFCTIVTGASRDDLKGQNLEGVESLLTEYPRSVPETLDECLINLTAVISHPAEHAFVDEHSCWWLFSRNGIQAEYFLRALQDMGFISYGGTVTGLGPMLVATYITILPAGWTRLSELVRKPSGERSQAFVAMWFDPSMEPYFNEGIRPAVEEAGTKCMRIDLKEHNNKICDEIIAEIRRSKYLIADFTNHRGGVYYEAGFAHGLGIPVIWSVRADDVPNLHFDTRQFSHITYTTPEELRTKLLNRIRATIT